MNINNLKKIFKNDVPCDNQWMNSSQLKMSPLLMGKPFRFSTPAHDAKKSSVMILVSRRNTDFDIFLTLRSRNLKNHGGQISFPGGRIENNETPLQAAIRETYEEIGVEPSNLEVIGKLSSLYVPPSNSIIYPFVAVLNKNEFHINTDEVEELIDVPMSFFLNESNIIYEDRIINGTPLSIPCWNLYKQEKLWGATAMILSEFIDIWKNSISV